MGQAASPGGYDKVRLFRFWRSNPCLGSYLGQEPKGLFTDKMRFQDIPLADTTFALQDGSLGFVPAKIYNLSKGFSRV